MEALLAELNGTVDCILTDPPYGKAHLDLYSDLARLAKSALRPGGMLAVMAGQAWLPDVLNRMTVHLSYRWTLIYETPGGPSSKLMDRRVLSRWKPVLLFGGKQDWIGNDVISLREKSDHEWQQSLSGMKSLIESVSKPGQLIVDPFLGSGTTALAALQSGRRFAGCDVDEIAVKIARHRIAGTSGDMRHPSLDRHPTVQKLRWEVRTFCKYT
jgi:DNA modification methylase